MSYRKETPDRFGDESLVNFIGIDLGTTYSVVAYINADGKPEVIPNEHGKSVTPSVVYFDGETAIVGDEAKEQQDLGRLEVASFFKRSMGDAQFLLSFHGRNYSPVDLSSFVLAYMKAQAERFLGTKVTDAVITVPAYFTHLQRTATIEAGRRADLNVLKIISEPTAAALAYGLRPSQNEQRVLVYDLGGGTFDISLVSITPDALRVIATDGDHNLGGKDWDDRLIEFVEQKFEEEYGTELIGDDFNELRVQSEKLKHALTSRQSAEIRVHAGGNSATYTVTREEFENVTRDLMERTQLLTERVLSAANLAWHDISGVLLVGGSTRMPMVRSYIERLCRKPPMAGIHPDEAVAQGAAIQAAIEENATPTYRLAGRKSTVDVIAHSLGMIAENIDRTRYINSILINKNRPIPSSESRPYKLTVRRSGNSQLEVYLTQGESEDPQQCSYLGRYVFTDFPFLTDKIAVLDITYTYDKNGIVLISAVERSSGQPLTLTVESVPPDVPSRFAGRPLDQKVREHLNIYLAFDLSGSMSGDPLKEAQKAAEKFVSECDLTTTSVGLISFSDRVHVEQKATQNINEIVHAIRHLSIGRTGYGNSGHPFSEIFKRLSNTSGVRYAIVLADGVWACQNSAIKEAQRCHAVGIEVIAIGFGQADRSFLAKIASSSEQSFFTDMNRLVEAFSTIAQELTETAGEKRADGKLRFGF
jgi:molecular chaperone DnaK